MSSGLTSHLRVPGNNSGRYVLCEEKLREGASCTGTVAPSSPPAGQLPHTAQHALFRAVLWLSVVSKRSTPIRRPCHRVQQPILGSSRWNQSINSDHVSPSITYYVECWWRRSIIPGICTSTCFVSIRFQKPDPLTLVVSTAWLVTPQTGEHLHRRSRSPRGTGSSQQPVGDNERGRIETPKQGKARTVYSSLRRIPGTGVVVYSSTAVV